MGLENEVLTPSSDAHNNRYIFWPDRLVRMPHPDDGLFSIVRQLLREPLFRNSGVFKPWTEFAAPPRPDSLEDESVGSFFARRVNAHVVDHILSAGLHGIYAGDCYQLSMKSLFPKLWAWEREYGSLGKALQQRDASKIDVLADDHALLMDFREQGVLGKPAHWDKAALYSFRGGVSTLVRALEKRLRSSRNVKIRTATTIAMMVPHRADHGGGIEVPAPMPFLFSPLFPTSLRISLLPLYPCPCYGEGCPGSDHNHYPSFCFLPATRLYMTMPMVITIKNSPTSYRPYQATAFRGLSCLPCRSMRHTPSAWRS